LEQEENQPEGIKEGKIYAMAAYWGPLCILPLIIKKDNTFAVFHGKQGLVLFIILVAGFLFNIIPWLGTMVWQVVSFLYVFAFLWGTLQALMGNCSKIPIISDIAEKIVL